MPVVSDSDVVIHASKLNILWLLAKLYSRVLIPQYVRDELFQYNDEQISIAVGKGILEARQTAEDKAEDIASQHRIHLGEAHVKVLADVIKASLVLSNERKVRKALKDQGFAVAGVIGVILRAVTEELITPSHAEKLLAEMKERNKGFRIHPDIIDDAVAELHNF